MPVPDTTARALRGVLLFAAFVAAPFALQSRAFAEPDPNVAAEGTPPQRPDAGTRVESQQPPGISSPLSSGPSLGLPREKSWIGAGAVLGVLNLPKVGVGAELVTELRFERLWPIELALTYWFENHAELSAGDLDLMLHPLFLLPYPESGSRLSVSLYELSVATCPWERHMGADSLLLCGGVQGGLMRVAAEGFAVGGTESHPTLALQLFARYRFRLGANFGISYSAGVFVALLRESFGYIDRTGVFQEAFRIAPVGGRLDLAVVYEL